MCPGQVSVMLTIVIFLMFTIYQVNATKTKKRIELQQYYQLPENEMPLFTTRLERLTNDEVKELGNEIERSNKNKVTIIGAVHGNEPVGYYALTDMIEKDEFRQYYNDMDFFIFSDPNHHGRVNNIRNSPWGDINRLWPKEYGPMEGLAHPVNVMLPYIDKVDLLIDVHEAVGYNRCQKSLGNTIYISDSSKKEILQPIIDELNIKLKNEWNHIPEDDSLTKCDQWDIITKLPATLNTTGTLDEYIVAIPEEFRPFYVLIEIPGQNNVQNLDKRMRTAKFLIHNIISKLDKLL